MQFQPKTEKEIAEMNLWPVGVYNFEVIERVTLGGKNYATSDCTSKAGNDMILLVLNVFNDAGDCKVLMDYILESGAAKLRNVAVACNLLDKYENGQLFAADFIGKKGDLRLGIEIDKSGQYPNKNRVANYITEKTEKESSSAVHPALDDSIPF